MLANCADSNAMAIGPRRIDRSPCDYEGVACKRGTCETAYLYFPKDRGIYNHRVSKSSSLAIVEIAELKYIL